MPESAPFSSVIGVVVDFAAEAFPARPALDCLRWLSAFAEWGYKLEGVGIGVK
jgi:hypothetical protein